MNSKIFYDALTIRVVENELLNLFSNGKISGTLHTCVGQEFSALAFAGKLTRKDILVSNHRGHGHYIAYFKEYKELVAEILGKKGGVCGGIGSSQHLMKDNFYTNGIQGGTLPLAAGMALSEKIRKTNSIAVVFIGDGTLGEGIVYETMNICSLWNIPLLIVCENNHYAQSTHESLNRSGDILKRAEAFNIKTKKSRIWNLEQLFKDAEESINYVRKERKPLFHLVDLYRLNAHSKGDDTRASEEISKFREIDPLVIFENDNLDLYQNFFKEIMDNFNIILKDLENEEELSLSEYIDNPIAESDSVSWKKQELTIDTRQVNRLNEVFKDKMKHNEEIVLLGEDILSPYGGAFKIYKDLSEQFPDRVFTTPISEAAITGIANGLALRGMKSVVEIMFGDFVTLAFDQIVNHASKFFGMYNKQVTCPVVLRTPMGGGRGYGPTHSQSLEKFLIGIDNTKVIALNALVDPYLIYEKVFLEKHPVIVLENKITYGKKLNLPQIKNYKIETDQCKYPTIKISPSQSRSTLTIVTYGNAEVITEMIYEIIIEHDLIPEIFILTQINPIDIIPVANSVEVTQKLLLIEEGNETGGFGAQILLMLKHKKLSDFKAQCLGSLPYPIPACKNLEREVLVNKKRIKERLERLKR